MATNRQHSPIEFTTNEDKWLKKIVKEQPEILHQPKKLLEEHQKMQERYGEWDFPNRLAHVLVRHHGEVHKGERRLSKTGKALRIKELARQVAKGILTEEQAIAMM